MNRAAAAREAHASRAVACPLCGAGPDRSCRVKSQATWHVDGYRYVRAHKERVAAWRAQRQGEQDEREAVAFPC